MSGKGLGYPIAMNDDQLKAIVKADPRENTTEIAQNLALMNYFTPLRIGWKGSTRMTRQPKKLVVKLPNISPNHCTKLKKE